ncbi:MAG: peptide-methionine (S)-S-oxide reductase MsrA [Granulosicoccus sp.]
MNQSVVRKSLISLSLLLACSLAAPAFAAKAVFAAGCFWCVEKDFEKLEGVTEAVSGFTGGTAENPTYNGDHTGHYEAVEVTYDPDVVSYQELLDHFWVNHDPFDARGQFCDKGGEYLAAVFVETDEQRALAESSKQAVIERFADQEVVTPILPLMTFYPIKGDEIYHQDFYKKSPIRYNTYRFSCGRDKRLKQIWGKDATV